MANEDDSDFVDSTADESNDSSAPDSTSNALDVSELLFQIQLVPTLIGGTERLASAIHKRREILWNATAILDVRKLINIEYKGPGNIGSNDMQSQGEGTVSVSMGQYLLRLSEPLAPGDEDDIGSSSVQISNAPCEEKDVQGFIEVGTEDASSVTIMEEVEVPHCAICFYEYVVGDLVARSRNLACTHMYHKACIVEWMLEQDTCPCCRCPYRSVEEEATA